jgi:hypothetical protein
MKECIFDGCKQKSISKKYCDKHYRRLRKYGDPSVVHSFIIKKCLGSTCELKAKSKGYCDKHYRRFKLHGTAADRPKVGFACSIDFCTRKHVAKGFCRRHYEMMRQRVLIDDRAEAIINNHEGLCDICRTDTPGYGRKALCIDHDHNTGIVRGMLCQKCNIGLGNFNDDPNLLIKAILYLKKSLK